VQPLQERSAPAAAGAGAVTFAQLAGHRGATGANKLLDLAARDVETETEFIVGFHTCSTLSSSPTTALRKSNLAHGNAFGATPPTRSARRHRLPSGPRGARSSSRFD